MKYIRCAFYQLLIPSPLAEGRELKSVGIYSPPDDYLSPLAEGRELKFHENRENTTALR